MICPLIGVKNGYSIRYNNYKIKQDHSYFYKYKRRKSSQLKNEILHNNLLLLLFCKQCWCGPNHFNNKNQLISKNT